MRSLFGLLFAFGLLLPAPAWAVAWLNTSGQSCSLGGGVRCQATIAGAGDTDCTNLIGCSSFSMELFTSGTITVMPQSCNAACGECNDLLVTPLNGSTVGGMTQVGAIGFIKGVVTYTAGSGILGLNCAP